MTDFDERALIERCRTGDDVAFGELVERYKHLVYGDGLAPDERPIAGGRPRAGGVPEGASRPAVFPGRGASVDVDFPHRLERVQRGSEPAHGGGRCTLPVLERAEPTARSPTSSCATGSTKRSRSLPEQLPVPDCRALSRRCPIRRAGRDAGHPDRHGEDAPVSREAPAAGAASMTCRDVAELHRTDRGRGDPADRTKLRAHLETCPSCAAALAAARRPRGDPCVRHAPPAPDRFVASVLQRVRRERLADGTECRSPVQRRR